MTLYKLEEVWEANYLKRFRLSYDGERNTRWISIVDRVAGYMIVLVCCFSRYLGYRDYLLTKLNLSEFWVDALIVLCAIAIMHVEQFVTYHIDKRISK